MTTNRKFPNRQSSRLRGFDYRHPAYYFVTFCTRDTIHYFGEIVKGKMVLTAHGQLAKQFWMQIPEHSKNVQLDEFVIMPNHIHGILRILDPCGDNAGFPYPFCQNKFDEENEYSIDFQDQGESFSLGFLLSSSHSSDPFNALSFSQSSSPSPSLSPFLSPSLSVRTLHCNVRTDREGAGSLEGKAEFSSLDAIEGAGSLEGKAEFSSLDASEEANSKSEIGDSDIPSDQIEFILKLESEMMQRLFPIREKGKNLAMSAISPKKGSLSAIIRTYKSAVSYSLHKMYLEFEWHCRFYDRIIRSPDELERIRWYMLTNPCRWRKNEI